MKNTLSSLDLLRCFLWDPSDYFQVFSLSNLFSRIFSLLQLLRVWVEGPQDFFPISS